MALSTYNGFDGKTRIQLGKQQEKEIRAAGIQLKACFACGCTSGVVPHLEDYNAPIEGLIPLCRLCHLMVHMRFRNRLAFARYRALINNGWTFDPGLGNYQTLRDRMETIEAERQGPRRDITILDHIDAGYLDPRRAGGPDSRSLAFLAGLQSAAGIFAAPKQRQANFLERNPIAARLQRVTNKLKKGLEDV